MLQAQEEIQPVDIVTTDILLHQTEERHRAEILVPIEELHLIQEVTLELKVLLQWEEEILQTALEVTIDLHLEAALKATNHLEVRPLGLVALEVEVQVDQAVLEAQEALEAQEVEEVKLH